LLGARTKDARSTPDSWPAERGTLVPFSDRSLFPRPITLVRYAGAGPLERLGEDALALSKMDWNNDALFDSLPVTIEYSKRLSQTIAYATSLPSGTYPYRLFM
jgi:argonaute-like protein implicated in RNA metabolism and viral defense